MLRYLVQSPISGQFLLTFSYMWNTGYVIYPVWASVSGSESWDKKPIFHGCCCEEEM